MINYVAQFLTIAGLHMLAVASPGPDFAITVKQSIRCGRRAALWTAVGIGSGICVHTAYSLLGFGLLLRTSTAVFTVMKLIAAGYLGYLGISALWPRRKIEVKIDGSTSVQAPSIGLAHGVSLEGSRGPSRPSETNYQPGHLGHTGGGTDSVSGMSPRRAYALGFWTNALNPKATLFFVALFSSVINPATPRLILIGYGAWMAVTTALWFSLVATFFTQARVRDAFLRLGPWFDRIMGIVLLALCATVAFSVAR